LKGSTGYFQPRAADAASIVAGPGDHEDRAVFPKIHRRLGDGLTGAEHQRKAGCAGSNREPVGALHLGCSQDFHVKKPDKVACS
jgi:hypothetical protein